MRDPSSPSAPPDDTHWAFFTNLLGYEDLNDHEELRRDPLLAVLAEKSDPRGETRTRERDRGKALAGKRTLNRLELSAAEVGSADLLWRSAAFS